MEKKLIYQTFQEDSKVYLEHRYITSICWKAVLWLFDLIGQSLVWRIGTGTLVRISIDPWLGCKLRHILPDSMIDKLHDEGYFVLKDIACNGTTLLQDRGWLNADFLGFDD